MMQRRLINIEKCMLITVSLFFIVLSTLSYASTLYKWIDENGEIRYSDRLPPDQLKKKHELLNQHGVVVDTKEAAKTREQLDAEAEEKKALELKTAEEERIKEKQDKIDRVLLLTFSSEDEMKSVHDNRIDVIESVIRLIRKSIAATEEQLIKLEDSADLNYLSKGKEVPGGLAQNIEHFTRKVTNRSEQLRLKEVEKQKIEEKFDIDLARYRWLKSQENN